MKIEMTANGERDGRRHDPDPSRTLATGYRGGTHTFICAHAVDRSLLKAGFTFAGAMVNDFTSWFGALPIGESREVVIRLDGKEHIAKVGNRGFDRAKYFDRSEMYQLRYNQTGTLAKALQEKFVTTRQIVEQTLAANGGDLKKRHIKIPAAQREQILFYRTDNPLVWEAEVQTADETSDFSKSIGNVDETLFEADGWTDSAAKIVLRPAVLKVRRLDRAIGQNLKIIYNHCCQICGEQVARAYGTHVDEVHHIDPFVTSLNNDASNLIVLCPNHHRIIHATHAEFMRRDISFKYPNGLVEQVKMDRHLHKERR